MVYVQLVTSRCIEVRIHDFHEVFLLNSIVNDVLSESGAVKFIVKCAASLGWYVYCITYFSEDHGGRGKGADEFKSLVTWIWILFPFHLKFPYILFSFRVYPIHLHVPIYYPWLFVFLILLFCRVFVFHWRSYIPLFSFHLSKTCSVWHNEWKRQDVALELLEPQKNRIALCCLSCPVTKSAVNFIFYYSVAF